MNWSLIVQFIRNALCLLKTLSPSTCFIHRIVFPSASEPFSKVSIVEYFISFTQIAAVVYNISSGYFNLLDGCRDYNRCSKLIPSLERLSITDSTKRSSSYTLLKNSIEKNKRKAFERTVIGFWEVVIGISFMFLAVNSLHLHPKGHPKPLIDALIAMEIGLAVILYYMFKNIWKDVLKCKINYRLIAIVDQTVTRITIQRLLVLAANNGYIEHIYDAFELFYPPYKLVYRRSINYEDCLSEDLSSITRITDIEYTLDHLIQMSNGDVNINIEIDSDDSTDSKHQSINMTILINKNLASVMKHSTDKSTFKVIVDIILFLLNIIAGYGYLLGILVFYFPKQEIFHAETNTTVYLISTNPLIEDLVKYVQVYKLFYYFSFAYLCSFPLVGYFF
jgi:hypothetical protein